MAKTQVQSQQIEKIISSVDKSIEIWDNIKRLFSNQEKLKISEERMIKEVDDIDIELNKIKLEKKSLNFPKRLGRIVTVSGGALSISSATLSGSLSLNDCSRKGDIISISGSTVGGVLALVGTGTEYYISKKEEKLLEREKDNQEKKKELEVKKEKDISNKHLRDVERLRTNWKDLKKIFKKFYLLQTKFTFSQEVDKALKNLLKSYNELVEKVKESLSKDSNKLADWLLLVSATESTEEKLGLNKEFFKILQQIWQESSISEKINELKNEIDGYYESGISELTSQKQQDEITVESNSSKANNNQLEVVIETLPKSS